ncbi:reverse transcriptase domain-containing protein [Nocardia sp. CC201C]|uniref:reverse transcriptase domain-containing protein n=1 Tax=Nocardia sp. CC201C TaxID=3044575 RepID=UPI0024A7CE48|nr:reverse transcriptase domain-containing protein [Nocardia sp. CC201C]
MQPMSTRTIGQLKISDSMVRIANYERNLVPQEAGWQHLTASSQTIRDVSRYLETLCRKGLDLAGELEVAARKSGHGVRPIAYWGIKESILYDALTEAALAKLPALDRTVERYIDFVLAPAKYAIEEQTKDRSNEADKLIFSIYDSKIKYVIKADITAFYQFIDHSILADELISQGADYEVVSHLVDLLKEVTGRPIGLPQLSEASDRLSEVYIDQVERSLLRQGFATWRFNDDFRIACGDFTEAIRAMEALDSAARAVGLALNEYKSFTYRLKNYILDAYSLKSIPDNGIISPNDIDVIVGDYHEDFSEDEEAALRLLRSAQNNSPLEDGIDLKHASRSDERTIRRALDSLAKHNNVNAFDSLLPIISFMPSLTPAVVRYVVYIANNVPDPNTFTRAATALDEIIEKVSLNDWQHVWVLDAFRNLNILGDEGSNSYAARLKYVEDHFHRGDGILRATAFHVLASADRLSVVEAITTAHSAPEAVRLAYLSGARDRIPTQPSVNEARSIQGLRDNDAITKAMLII